MNMELNPNCSADFINRRLSILESYNETLHKPSYRVYVKMFFINIFKTLSNFIVKWYKTFFYLSNANILEPCSIFNAYSICIYKTITILYHNTNSFWYSIHWTFKFFYCAELKHFYNVVFICVKVYSKSIFITNYQQLFSIWKD